MIPLKNLRPRTHFPTATVALIVINFVVFFYQLTLDPRALQSFIMTYSMVPARAQLALAHSQYTLAQGFFPLFTSMFLHAGWLHIIGNMWFLWLFGPNVEDRLGHFPYLGFYLVCGLGAGIAQTLFSLGSTIPGLGASGAIAGVLGAYVVFFPSSRILTLVTLFFWWFFARLPAVLFIGLWFAVQFLSGIGSLGSAQAGGVAWWAHVGGFLLGMLLVSGMRRNQPEIYYNS
ncbi:MAG TPA: rhomboid family intramembrane serine protease [Candidatus Acidoferrales bacterium]|jgi:membrane associated rhomboid family serine protease|nr:rhomboid family intramembrane serine protease [Candidatus Acidoferrales bacterium]